MLSQQQCWRSSRRRIFPGRIALVRRLPARGVRRVRPDIHRRDVPDDRAERGQIDRDRVPQRRPGAMSVLLPRRRAGRRGEDADRAPRPDGRGVCRGGAGADRDRDGLDPLGYHDCSDERRASCGGDLGERRRSRRLPRDRSSDRRGDPGLGRPALTPSSGPPDPRPVHPRSVHHAHARADRGHDGGRPSRAHHRTTTTPGDRAHRLRRSGPRRSLAAHTELVRLPAARGERRDGSRTRADPEGVNSGLARETDIGVGLRARSTASRTTPTFPTSPASRETSTSTPERPRATTRT